MANDPSTTAGSAVMRRKSCVPSKQSFIVYCMFVLEYETNTMQWGNDVTESVQIRVLPQPNMQIHNPHTIPVGMDNLIKSIHFPFPIALSLSKTNKARGVVHQQLPIPIGPPKLRELALCLISPLLLRRYSTRQCPRRGGSPSDATSHSVISPTVRHSCLSSFSDMK